MKHTPGPWKVVRGCWIQAPSGIGLARVYVRGTDEIPGTLPRDANAALMAAAPEMLEALRRMLNGPSPDDTESPEDMARAAIASAERKVTA